METLWPVVLPPIADPVPCYNPGISREGRGVLVVDNCRTLPHAAEVAHMACQLERAMDPAGLPGPFEGRINTLGTNRRMGVSKKP